MAATPALRNALNQGISSGNLADTKIILYSHRDFSGRVCRPRTLYASSPVLKTVPYFGARESTVTLNTTRTVPDDHIFKVLSWIPAGSQSKDSSKGPINDEESAEDYGYTSDSDLEDDGDEKDASFKCENKLKVGPLDLLGIPDEDRSIVCEEHDECVEKGRVVKISDVAFVT